MSKSLEETLAQGVKDHKVPHAVVRATNADGDASELHPFTHATLLTPDQAVRRTITPPARKSTAPPATPPSARTLNSCSPPPRSC